MKSKTIFIALIVFINVFVILLITKPIEATEDLDAKKEALNVIADFADRLCKDIPLGGDESGFELSGNASSELNSLIKKMVDLKIEGAGRYQKSEYQGLLRKDLVNALNTSTDCKLAVFLKLEEKLIVRQNGRDRETAEQKKATEAVRDPYNYEWKCGIVIKDDSGQQIASGELVFGKVINEPNISFARVRFNSKRTRRLAPEITFDSAAWSMGYFGKCLEGECMSFVDNTEPHVPVFMANKVVFDEENGRINISGVVMTKKYSKHSRLGFLSGVCQPR